VALGGRSEVASETVSTVTNTLSVALQLITARSFTQREIGKTLFSTVASILERSSSVCCSFTYAILIGI